MTLSTSSSPPTSPTRRHIRDSNSPPSNPFSPVSPPSAPRNHVDPASQPLETLTDAQLIRLTRSNTRKNLGTRRGRLRSQLERVYRRLDNIAVDIHLTRRTALTPVPVVNPDGSVEASPQQTSDIPTFQEVTPTAAADLTPSTAPPHLDLSPPSRQDTAEDQQDDDFAIEPATEDSLFDGKLDRRSTAATAPILNGVEADFSLTSQAKTITGAERRSSKSVRISTSVTYLDYSRARKGEPLSVSSTTRFDHPTRKDRSALMRRALEADAFPRAKLSNTNLGKINRGIINRANEDDSEPESLKRQGSKGTERKKIGKGLGLKLPKQKGGGSVSEPFSTPSPRGAYGPREAEKKVERGGEGVGVGGAKKERRPSTMTTPTAAYAVSAPNGPYAATGGSQEE